MTPSGERGQTTKTAAEDRRRLLAVGRADPFLVTKLPQNGTVASGIVKLDGGGILGFAHQPLPEGTRVRVAYQEWLYAVRLPDDGRSGDGTPKGNTPADGVAADGGTAEEADVVEESVAEQIAATENVAEKNAADNNAADNNAADNNAADNDLAAMKTSGTATAGGTADGASLPREGARGDAQRSDDEFPDDLARGNREVPSVGEDGERKSWTDAFGSGTGGSPDREA